MALNPREAKLPSGLARFLFRLRCRIMGTHLNSLPESNCYMIRYYQGSLPNVFDPNCPFTTSLSNALAWLDQNPGMELWYVDVSVGDPVRQVNENGIVTVTTVLPPTISRQRKFFGYHAIGGRISSKSYNPQVIIGWPCISNSADINTSTPGSDAKIESDRSRNLGGKNLILTKLMKSMGLVRSGFSWIVRCIDSEFEAKSMKRLFVLILILFFVFVWPSIYRYDTIKRGSHTFLVRTNRVTGNSQTNSGSGWE